MSNLPISIEIYKKIYYNLPQDEKENIQKIIEANNQSFFEYFIANSEVHQIIYKEANMWLKPVRRSLDQERKLRWR